MNDIDSDTVVAPSEELRRLGRLVGTWRLTGEAEGTVRYEWLTGGFFLLQHVDLVHGGNHVVGLEVIGHDRPFGQPPGEVVSSRFYGSTGDTLSYVYEFDGDVLVIWGGEKGSPAFCRTEFGADGNTMASSWVYPGGGYRTTAARVPEGGGTR
ncbi:hypothetical protein ACFY3U_25310 [Micromonospora sp. NPDC000089]|uniref:hypothetical protein n=1 Tax=unclassified Micromonospora TaxID=2617518 RepID=UPI0036C0F28D